MADWLFDPVNGSNSYSGDSWTVTLSGTDGQTYGTTKFTSAAGGFTPAMVGRYIRILGTLIKIVAYVSTTEVTLDTTFSSGYNRSFWIGGPLLSWSSVSSYIVAGDKFKYAKTANSDAVSAGLLTWANNSPSVAMASGRVKDIDGCESGWVPSTNVTLGYDTTYATEGTKCMNIKTESAFTTGKVAYKQIGGGSPVDFSGYQGIAFMVQMRGSTSVTAAQGWRICLCSDTTGDVIVDDLAYVLPASLAKASAPVPMVIWKGGNLGSSIQSIAIYVTADPGTPTQDFDNFIAIKDIADSDHICPKCVLSQGEDLQDDNWWGIKSIVDGTVILTGEFYGGTDGAVSSYRREVVPIATQQIFSSTYNGTRGAEAEVSGGWNPSTGLQDGVSAYYPFQTTPFSFNSNCEFWKMSDFLFAMPAGASIITFLSGHNGLIFERLNFCGLVRPEASLGVFGDFFRGSTYDAAEVGFQFKHLRAMGTGTGFLMNVTPQLTYRERAVDWYLEDVICYSCRGMNFEYTKRLRGVDVDISNCSGSSDPRGIGFGGALHHDVMFNRLTLKDNPSYGIWILNGVVDGKFYNLVTSGNAGGVVRVAQSDLVFFNPSMAEASKYLELSAGGRAVSIKEGGIADNHLITAAEGTIQDETSVRHTASGIAWLLNPTNSSGWPLQMKIAEVAVAAGTYEFSVYMRRDNTGLTGKFWTPGGQVGGVPDEVSDTITAAINMWERQTISVTTTESGVLEFFVSAQGGTTYSLYVDDFAVEAV